MKTNLNFVKVILILLFLSGCSTKIIQKNFDEENLIGKWKLSNSYSPDYKKIVDSVIISLKRPENYKGVLLPEFALFPEGQDSVMSYDNTIDKDMIYEFNKNGRFKKIYLNQFVFEDGKLISKNSGKAPDIFQGNWKVISKGSIELDFDKADFLKLIVAELSYPNGIDEKELNRRKKIPFEYLKVTKDSLYLRRNIYENNFKNYEYINDIYLKVK